MTYAYCIITKGSRHEATLNKGDAFKLKAIGTFGSQAEAKAACEKHHLKACRMAEAAGRQVPQIAFY